MMEKQVYDEWPGGNLGHRSNGITNLEVLRHAHQELRHHAERPDAKGHGPRPYLSRHW